LAWAVSAALGGFLFGYNAGVISGALLAIRGDFALRSWEQGLLVALLPLGAMVGSLLNGRLADGLGRRRTLLLDAVVFIVGTALAAAAPGYAVLLVARAITGLAVGSAASTVPLYLSEIAPPNRRGGLVTLNQLMITLGVLTSYCVDYAFAGSGSWRAMFAIGLIPAAAFLLGMLGSPETPIWLQAREEHDRPPRHTLRALLAPTARPALVVGVTLAVIQQFSGINAVIYYAPSVMEKTGLSAANSLLYSVVIGAINVAATLAALPLVDRLGRRPLLLLSLGGMAVSLALLGLQLETATAASGNWPTLLCLIAYIVSFAIGLGPVYWLLVAEVFPPSLRAAGAGLSTAVVWLSNFVVGLAFLPLAGWIGQGATFWIFAAVAALGLVFVSLHVPETKGRSFAEIDAELRARQEDGRLQGVGSR
jgi:MFS family permease